MKIVLRVRFECQTKTLTYFECQTSFSKRFECQTENLFFFALSNMVRMLD